jgi:hypothetical protein
MNLKITEDQFNILKKYVISEYIFGSWLHKTNTVNSDKDVLLILDDIFVSDRIYPNIHCFQYDDVKNNIQWMLTTESTFNKNLLSGESNIFAELVLFSEFSKFNDKLLTCRTVKIIKGFIGRAKFDLKLLGTSKDKKNRKAFHISRCLYIAECLLDNKLPDLNLIGCYSDLDKDALSAMELNLRNKCVELYEKNELHWYPVLSINNQHDELNELDEMLAAANNLKEFNY